MLNSTSRIPFPILYTLQCVNHNCTVQLQSCLLQAYPNKAFAEQVAGPCEFFRSWVCFKVNKTLFIIFLFFFLETVFLENFGSLVEDMGGSYP